MKDRCVEAVSKAAGRVLTQAEIKGIEDRITGNMKWLSKQDPAAWAKMSGEARLAKASELANKQLVGDAVRKKEAIIKNAAIVADAQAFMASRVAKGETNLTAIQRMLAPLRDLKGGVTSISQDIKGIAADLTRNLWELKDVTGKFAGMFQNKKGLVDVIKELYGENSGNAQARDAARSWQSAAEDARNQMNYEGGAIGYLKKYRTPQTHDPAKAWKMGEQMWVEQKMNQVDRGEYVNTDGSAMNDEQMRGFLSEAWKAITRDGNEEALMGQGGSARRADNGMDHRTIIFKDWESALAHETELGTGDPVHLLIGHFDRMATDIALIKHLGDNPDNMIAHLIDMAYRADLDASGHPIQTRAAKFDAQKLYDYIAGHHDPVYSESVKYVSDVAQGIHVASKLGSAVISALADPATMVMAANTNRMPVMQMFRNMLSTFNLANTAEKNFAQRAGLMHEMMTSEITRWGTDNLSHTWAGKLSVNILKLSLLNTWTAAEKRAFGIGMYDLMGKLSRDHETMATLHKDDAATLDRLGISEDVFQVWRKAETTSRNGSTDTVLTPDAIYAISDVDIASKRNAAQALIGIALADMDVAVPTTRARDRYEASGFQRGTVKGEIWRQMALFKATPYALFREQWGRMMSQDGGFNRAIYGAKFLALTTLMGAFSSELDQLLNGKDPIDPSANPIRFGARALLKGGGLGFFGDFMFSDKTLQGQIGALAGVSGPSGSTLEALLRLTVGNASLAFTGKETHVGSNAADLAKSVIPGANLWYLKAVFNHLWIHYIQDVIQPGYSSRLESRAMHEFGQQYWWHPGDLSPDRLPNMGAAFGQ